MIDWNLCTLKQINFYTAVIGLYCMKKIVTIGLLSALLSCTPYQRLFLNPAHLDSFLENSCDVEVIHQVKSVLDSTEYWTYENPDILLNHVHIDTACQYHLQRFFQPLEKDSAVWFLTIRTVHVGKDDIVLGNLYTFRPDQDTLLSFERRVKQYAQANEFESGKYVGFTYYMKNDSTSVVKTGTRIF